MTSGPLVVRITVGTPRQEWCDTCMTSGRFILPLLSVTQRGVTELGTADRCLTCEGAPRA